MQPLSMFKFSITMREKSLRPDLVVHVRLKDRKVKGMWGQEKYLQAHEDDFVEALQTFGMEHAVEIYDCEHPQMKKLIDMNVSPLALHVAAKIFSGSELESGLKRNVFFRLVELLED